MDARTRLRVFLSGVASLGVCFSLSDTKPAAEIVGMRLERIKHKAGGNVTKILANDMQQAVKNTEIEV